MYGGGGGGGQWPGQQQQPAQSGFMQSQQTGYIGMQQQRPMMTGMPMQQTGANFLGAQPTGMGMPMGGSMSPMGIQPQATGMGGMNMPMGGMGMNAGLGGMRQGGYGQPGSGMMGQAPQQQQQAQQRYLSPNPMQMQPQQTGMMSPRPPMGMQPQMTGYPIQMQQTGLMPQMTGMPMDPRLQLMSMQFLPAAQPFSGAPTASNMNFSSASMQPSNFQSSIQNLSQQQQGSKEPKIPWALSKEERKSYDSIFRAWDAKGTGFVSGDVAREVFGQSGLDRDRLMQVWHLSDTENRGKLNLAEFHVAMGLIYRALNGNDLPEHLPSELVPPSARDLNDSVDFLKDLLKRDTNVRHTTGLNLPESGSNSNAAYSKSHSFHENPIQKQDAAAYKHSDEGSAGYRSSSRHLDRRTVRYGGESAADDLSEMKRQLARTQQMLDSQEDKDEDDREVEKEMDELRFRIKRVQDDIDYYNRRGGRDAGENRRKAERELLHLMHERLPLLEKRLEEKDRRQRDKRAGESRDRDRRNETFEARKRYDDDHRDYSFSSRRERDDDGSSYGRSGTPMQHDREQNRQVGRAEKETPRDRTPPPLPPPPSQISQPAPAPPAPPSVAAVAAPTPPAPKASAPPKNMSAEERQAWIRSEAQRRIQERMRALGAAAPPSSVAPSTPGQDASVEQRLAADRAEAEARSAQADAEAAAREEARRARLEEQKIQQEKAAVSTIKSELKEQEKSDQAPPALVMQAAREEVDEQEAMLRRREEILKKEKEERLARFKKLEEEEAEAKQQEEAFKQRQDMFQNKSASSSLPAPVRKGKSGPAPPPPSRSKAAASTQSTPAIAPPPPPPPSAPQQTPANPMTSPPTIAAPAPPVSSTPSGSSSTNPFHRMQPNGAAPPITPSGGTNPFYRSQQGEQGPASSLPAPQRSAAALAESSPAVSSPPPSSKSVVSRAPIDDDDWGDDHDRNDDDDDGPGSTTRATRQNLAAALFSGIVPSTAPSTPPPAKSTPTVSAALNLAPPSAPLMPAGTSDAQAAPSAPAPPPAPVAAAPSVSNSTPAPAPADRGALLGQIQGGLKLRKAQTNDRSGASVSGAVIGDATPPVQKFVPPPTPPAGVVEMTGNTAADASVETVNPKRQSVDWAGQLASDQMNGNAKASVMPDEPSVREEEEDSEEETEVPEDLEGPRSMAPAAHSDQNGSAHTSAPIHGADVDEVDNFDMAKTIRVRALYNYDGQRAEDLSFVENAVILAHPGKDHSNDWWYGTLTGSDGKSAKGTFPRIYVQSVEQSKKAKALYDFVGTSSEEMDLDADQEVDVVDDQDEHWWKVIDNAKQRILLVPATYVELSDTVVHVGPDKEDEAESFPEKVVDTSEDPTEGTAVMLRSKKPPKDVYPPSSQEPDLLDEEEEMKRVLKESETEARLDQVARAREEKDLKRALVLSAVDETAGSNTTDEGNDSDSTTGWTTSEEDESDEEEESEEAKQLRAAERVRVLQAAGILQLEENGRKQQQPKRAEDVILRRRSTKKPKPERPDRHIHIRKEKPSRPTRAPPPPSKDERPPEVEMEDAYDRYVKMTSEVQSSVPLAVYREEAPRKPSVSLSPASSPAPGGMPSSQGGGLFSTLRNFSRMGAGSPAERKPTPTISAPLSVRTGSPRIVSPALATADSLSSMQREVVASAGGGEHSLSSWSSLIDEKALNDIPEWERKRQEAIFELIRTEGTHVRDLQIIVEVFFTAILDAPFMSLKARTVIFANVEEILLAAVSLLSDLEVRQKESRLYVTRVGDILNQQLQGMKVYLPYCVNQSPARHILETERERIPELDALLIHLRNNPAARGLDLSSFLLVPMQRLTRYPLLLSQIARYTDGEVDPQELQDLQSAMQTAQRLLDTTNEAIRSRESNERLATLSQHLSVNGQVKLDLTAPTRFLGPRTIVKEDVLTKQKSGRKITVVLCSDLLLLLHGNRLYRMPMPLEELIVRDVPAGLTGRDDLCFQLLHQGRERTNLRCATARACHTWMHTIESTRSDCLAAANKAGR